MNKQIKELVERVRLTDKEIDNSTPSKEEVLEYMQGITSDKVENWDLMSEEERLLTAFSILSSKKATEAQLNKVLNDPDLALIDREIPRTGLEQDAKLGRFYWPVYLLAEELKEVKE